MFNVEVIKPNTTKPLDFLFVNPSLDYKLDENKKLTKRIEKEVANQESPNVGIGYLIAVAKRAGYQAKFIDMPEYRLSVEELLDYIEEYKPLIIGFTAFTVEINSAAALASIVKERFPSIKIVIGGPHAVAMPQEVLEEYPCFDISIPGEMEMVFTDLIDCIRCGANLGDVRGICTREHTHGAAPSIDNLDDLPFPAWEEFDLNHYAGLYPHRTTRELPMVTSRGCYFRCSFCVRQLGDIRKSRSVQSIIDEMNYLSDRFDCKSVCFLDETFIHHVRFAKELFRGMIDSGINQKISWSCSTRVDNTSQELFDLMKESGAYYVFVGLESADEKIIKNIKKRITPDQMRRTAEMAKNVGILVAGAFIIGLPGETEETVWKSINLAKELDIYSNTFPIAVPFPASHLRELALNNEYGLRILSNNWDHYGKQFPGVMESDELPIQRRRDLQAIAYEELPKKKIDEYLARIGSQRNLISACA
ncbi:B12-binding domain-containing radical SAM protein [bacterium]|nr:B12-binding domain-containing radical SAM protein [bacterium]